MTDFQFTISSHGRTPLYAAAFSAFSGQADVAEVLLGAGADPNAQTSLGSTPLDTAERRDHHAVARLLRRHGGKTSDDLDDGSDPFGGSLGFNPYDW